MCCPRCPEWLWSEALPWLFAVSAVFSALPPFIYVITQEQPRLGFLPSGQTSLAEAPGNLGEGYPGSFLWPLIVYQLIKSSLAQGETSLSKLHFPLAVFPVKILPQAAFFLRLKSRDGNDYQNPQFQVSNYTMTTLC